MQLEIRRHLGLEWLDFLSETAAERIRHYAAADYTDPGAAIETGGAPVLRAFLRWLPLLTGGAATRLNNARWWPDNHLP